MSNVTVTVTILKPGRCDDWGVPLIEGNSYSLDIERAKSLWQAGFASVADATIFEDSNTPYDGGFSRYFRLPGFRRSLLASLVAGSTSSRSKGLVTVTATAHGVPTGATYVGSRFFYPGSPNLAAGWYDSVVEVTTNTIAFTAPGNDFASESVNGGAIYTTETTAWSGTLYANTVVPGSELFHRAFKTCTNSANSHFLKSKIGSVGNILHFAIPATSVGNSWSVGYCAFLEGNRAVMVSGAMASGNSGASIVTLDPTVDQPLSLTLQLSATAEFIAAWVSNWEIQK